MGAESGASPAWTTYCLAFSGGMTRCDRVLHRLRPAAFARPRTRKFPCLAVLLADDPATDVDEHAAAISELFVDWARDAGRGLALRIWSTRTARSNASRCSIPSTRELWRACFRRTTPVSRVRRAALGTAQVAQLRRAAGARHRPQPAHGHDVRRPDQQAAPDDHPLAEQLLGGVCADGDSHQAGILPMPRRVAPDRATRRHRRKQRAAR